MSREEHLEWCKQRAIEYVDAGDVDQAFASMASDMRKHSLTSDHVGLDLMARMYFAGRLSTPAAMKKFITDFN